MDNAISSENTSFNYLKNSKDFLNIVLDNIGCAVLLFDKQMHLQAFNDSMKTMFVNKENEDLLYIKCGNAIGCAFAVEEETECGKTSHCSKCELRKNALHSYSSGEAIYRRRLDRYFYKTDYIKELKHLQYSTRHFKFEKDNYILAFVEDITQLVQQKHFIDIQREKILTMN